MIRHQVYSYFIVLTLFASCHKDVLLKCDYVFYRDKNAINYKKDFYSEFITVKQDTVFRYSHFVTDSNHVIIKDFSHELLECFTDSTYLLYEAFLLKNNVVIGTQWKSKEIDKNVDSVTIILRDIIRNKHFHDYVSNYCYVYEVDYSKVRNWYSHFTSYIIYFDFEKKILLRRDCFNKHTLLGTEELVKMTKVKNPPTSAKYGGYHL